MAAIAERDIEIAHFVCTVQGPQGAHRLDIVANIATATRGILLHALELCRHITDIHIQPGHQGRIEVDLHFAVYPASTRDFADPIDGQHGLADFVIHKPGQFALVHIIGRGDKGENGVARGCDFGHGGGRHGGRQLGTCTIHCITHQVECFFTLGINGELHGNADTTISDGGGHMLNATDGRNFVFNLARHFGFQLRRRRTFQRRAHGDDRQFNIRKVLFA